MRGHVSQRGTKFRYMIDQPRLADGKRRQLQRSGFATRTEADRALTAKLKELDDGRVIDTGPKTLGKYLDEWGPTLAINLKETTRASYTMHVNTHLRPALGTIELRKLAPAQLTLLYAQLMEGTDQRRPLAAATVRRIHATLHRALQDAVDNDLILRNPASKAKLPRPKRTTMSYWSPEQTRAFLVAVAEDRLFALYRLACFTGMRRGELLGLRWEDVDLGTREVTVRRALTVADYKVIETTTKSDRERKIAIDPTTGAALARHRETQDLERSYSDSWQESGLVFCDEAGRHLHPERVSSWFGQRVRAVGLPRLRFHDLRHSYATAALQARVPIKVVSERLGHANVAITSDRYSHVLSAMDQEAADTVASVIDGA